MYAIVEDGARQYRVSEGDELSLDYRDVEIGTSFDLPKVLLLSKDSNVKIGQPTLAGAKVVVEVLEFRSEKYTIQKFRRRKTYRRFKGHRQWFTRVTVKQIVGA